MHWKEKQKKVYTWEDTILERREAKLDEHHI